MTGVGWSSLRKCFEPVCVCVCVTEFSPLAVCCRSNNVASSWDVNWLDFRVPLSVVLRHEPITVMRGKTEEIHRLKKKHHQLTCPYPPQTASQQSGLTCLWCPKQTQQGPPDVIKQKKPLHTLGLVFIPPPRPHPLTHMQRNIRLESERWVRLGFWCRKNWQGCKSSCEKLKLAFLAAFLCHGCACSSFASDSPANSSANNINFSWLSFVDVCGGSHPWVIRQRGVRLHRGRLTVCFYHRYPGPYFGCLIDVYLTCDAFEKAW